LQRESDGIREEVADVLVSLQFQDRVSQILTHLENDMERLEREAGERRAKGGSAMEQFDVSAWLKELAKTFTTAEQRIVHSGGGENHTPSPEITFF
jgi:methyl-accepting chemotaxis protein